MYAITAATGHFGRHVIDTLIADGVAPTDIRAVVRTPANATDLADRGVQVRRADYNDLQALTSALEGIQDLLLISGTDFGNRIAQHANIIEAATTCGVEHIAYTSVLRADTSNNPVAAEHVGTEERLRASGIPHSLLRNSWYAEVYLDQLPQFLETGEILGASGVGRISMAARQDYAEAAAAVLSARPRAPIAIYELGGDARTFTELAETISSVTGIGVRYRDLSAPDYLEALTAAGLPPEVAGMAVAIDESIARGDLETDCSVLAQLIGRPLTSLQELIMNACERVRSPLPGR